MQWSTKHAGDLNLGVKFCQQEPAVLETADRRSECAALGHIPHRVGEYSLRGRDGGHC